MAGYPIGGILASFCSFNIAPRYALIQSYGKRHHKLEDTVIDRNEGLEIRPVFSLIVINKAGGLIYHRDFQPEGSPNGLNNLSTNDYLVLAGTFHGVHAITKQITPRLVVSSYRPSSSSATGGTSGHSSSPSGVAAVAANVLSPTASVFSNLTKTLDRGGGGGGSGSSNAPGGNPAQWSSSSATSATSRPSSLSLTASKSRNKDQNYPVPGLEPSGLEVLETDRFKLTCFQTITGTKFLLFTDPAMMSIEVNVFMRRIYELYADYVMKNPFYSLEMPVRCDGFDRGLTGMFRGKA
ncbi:hypothetical protein KEM54_006970 [Ascosphaera aggregata]|nr:hypothetical protein KEM54_006970 [Ascosphaera aggregata]